MGCFNMTGGISHLPMRAGDEIVAIIGFYNPKTSYGQEFCPGYDFTPLFFPVVGEYNDYGNIEYIKEDYNSNYIKEFFECDDLEELFNVIDDAAVDRYMDTKEKKLWKKINAKAQEIVKSSFHYEYMKQHHKSFNLQLGFMLEHKFVYDFLATRNENDEADFFYIDIEKSYDETKKFIEEYKNSGVKDKVDLDSKEVTDLLEKNAKEGNLSEKEKSLLKSVVNSFGRRNYDKERKIKDKFDPFKTHLRYLGMGYGYSFIEKGVGYMFDEIFLYPYKINEEKLFAVENKDAYLGFVRFFYNIMEMEIILRQHSYAGQHESYRTHYDFHKACCDFLEGRIKEEEEEAENYEYEEIDDEDSVNDNYDEINVNTDDPINGGGA